MKVLPMLLLTLFLLAAAGQTRAEKLTIDQKFDLRDGTTISLRIDGGEVQVSRNEENECQVWIEYLKDKCRAEVNYDKKSDELEVYINHDNWSLARNSDGEKSRYAKVRIALPYKDELNISGEIKAGKLMMTLGDLQIRKLELRSFAGEARIDFDKPNRCDMETFDVDFKVGEVKLFNLGNAGFKEADINSSVGSMLINFNGEKIKQTMARIDLEVGETTIIVPEEVGVKVKVSKFLFLSNVEYPNWFRQDGSYYYSRNYDDKKESLYLVISTGIGELNLRVDKKSDR